MCVPAGRGTFIRKKTDPAKRVTQGLGERVDAAAAADNGTAGESNAPTAGGAAPAPAPGGVRAGAQRGGAPSLFPREPIPGDTRTYFGDVIYGNRDQPAPTTPVVTPRPGGDVVTTAGRTKKKAGDVLRSGILSTVRTAGAGSLASLFTPSAGGGTGGKEKLGQ